MRYLILLILICFNLKAQEASQYQEFADRTRLPLYIFHQSSLNAVNGSSEDKQILNKKFNSLIEKLGSLPQKDFETFFQMTKKFHKDENNRSYTFENPQELIRLYNNKDMGPESKIYKMKFGEKTVNIGHKEFRNILARIFVDVAQEGNIQRLNSIQPEKSSRTTEEEPAKVAEPIKAISPDSIKSKLNCQDELNSALETFLTENREQFIKTQFRITSLKLAKKTKNSNKESIEELLKSEKAQLQKIKDNEESEKKLKELYRTHGFEEDSKIITEIDNLTKKASSLNYYRPSQQLLNEDLSAYILANVADPKNTIFDETDAATAWLFDELQTKYINQGNTKFDDGFNLMNLSNASFLYNHGIDESGKKIDLSEALSSSEKVLNDAYQEFLTHFKEEKKECFEKGSEWDGECDEELLGMIEKGFADDLKKIMQGMKNKTTIPDFNVDGFKLADTEISFKDLMVFDIATLKVPIFQNKGNKKSEVKKSKNEEPSKVNKSAKSKEVSEKEFTVALKKALKLQPPYSTNAFALPGSVIRSQVGKCSMRITKLNNGKTRVELLSPKNKQSYNLTLNSKMYSFNSHSIPVDQIVASYNDHYNKPHIRNSCLAN